MTYVDKQKWTNPVIQDDGVYVDKNEPVLSYEEAVALAEVQQQKKRQTPSMVILPPSVSNAERFARESELRRQERKRRQRFGEGRAMTEVDNRGVRGEQLAEPLTPSETLTAINEGRGDALEPYYSEPGREDRAPDSTSWVRNVQFSARLLNNVSEILIARPRPRRVVNDPTRTVLRTVDQSGQLGIGGEYAVFSYDLMTTDPVIQSNRDDVIDIELTAYYDGVSRTMLPNGQFRLELNTVHSYLETTNEVPVSLPGGILIQKEHDARNLGLTTAVVDGPYYRYTFRKDPTSKQWLLVRADWWVMRHQLQGLRDVDRFLHWRTRFSVSGAETAAGTFTVLETEDPTSNFLAPLVQLDLLPDVDDGLGGELELYPNESLSFEFDVSLELVPTARTRSTGVVKKTIWTELPALGFRLLRTDALIALADKRDIADLEIVEKAANVAPLDTRQYETSAAGLQDRDVLWSLAPSTTRPGGYVIKGLSVGPFRRQAAYDALRDFRAGI